MLPSKVFEFLKLPAEIRNMVYWNALVKRYKCRRFRQPPLTLVNKQIRSETLPIIYGNGKFYIVWKYRHRLKRSRKPCPMPPAMSNFTNITELNLKWRFEIGISAFESLSVDIYMKNDESEDSRLQNKNKELVGRPGLEWKDRVGINATLKRLLVKEISPRLPSPVIGTFVQIRFEFEMKSVVRGLLYFAEKYPVAAEWVWMAVKIHWNKDFFRV